MPKNQSNKLPGRKPTVPITRLIELRQAGLSLQDIGSIVGLSKQAVGQRLQAAEVEFEGLKVYQDKQPEILEALTQRLVYSLTDDVIKKIPGGTRILNICQLVDKVRLLRGQPGLYVQYQDFLQAETEADQEIERLQLELASLGD
jgi:hypothetical protein